ncbi:MAG: DNA repair protein RecO [Patescibacteria group bacterium]
MAHQHYRTKGFVLAKRNSGEADQIFTLYTQDFGKIEVVGRAIRKITSKLKASIDVFYFIEVEFIQGKNRKTLTDAIIIDKFLELRKNSEALACVGQMAGVVSRLILQEKSDKEIWQLLSMVFQRLNYKPSPKESKLPTGQVTINHKLVLHYFLWNFFSLLGYSPELYSCPICSKKLLPETFFLSPHYGGVICWQCCDKAKKESQQFLSSEIMVDSVKLIRFFVKEPIEKVERLSIWEKDLQNLNKAFDIYFSFLAEICGG